MNWDSYEGVKAADMIRVLRKLGYEDVEDGKNSVRVLRNKEGDTAILFGSMIARGPI